MRVGLSAYDIEASELVALAQAADESLWLGEHVVLPVDYGSEHPTTGASAHQHHTGPIIDPSTILLDPLVALGGAAAVTERMLLATGIYLLPLRHPLAVEDRPHLRQLRDSPAGVDHGAGDAGNRYRSAHRGGDPERGQRSRRTSGRQGQRRRFPR